LFLFFFCLHRNKNSSIAVSNGDVDVSFPHDVTINFASNTGLFCFHATASYGGLTNASCAAGMTVGSVNTAVNASGVASPTVSCTGQVQMWVVSFYIFFFPLFSLLLVYFLSFFLPLLLSLSLSIYLSLSLSFAHSHLFFLFSVLLARS
jgi:hypothetical protein